MGGSQGERRRESKLSGACSGHLMSWLQRQELAGRLDNDAELRRRRETQAAPGQESSLSMLVIFGCAVQLRG